MQAALPAEHEVRFRPRRAAWKNLWVHAVLLMTALLSLYPFFLILQNSFKSNEEVLLNPGGWPENFTLASYRELFDYQGNQVLRSFANSVFIATTSTVLAV